MNSISDQSSYFYGSYFGLPQYPTQAQYIKLEVYKAVLNGHFFSDDVIPFANRIYDDIMATK